jgi:uncharacterized membrane protein YfcA
MEFIVITLGAFLAAMLTLFSGFGVSMVLVPVAIIYFPIPLAIALAAVVHLVSNLYKLAQLWRQVDWRMSMRFGLPAMLAAIPGALLLKHLAGYDALFSYSIGTATAEVTLLKIIVGVLLIFFATAEWLPFFQRLHPSKKFMPIGGIMSGFFGGLSGQQGFLRSAFFFNAGLNKDQFVATNAAIGVLVDVARLLVYGAAVPIVIASLGSAVVLSASIAACMGGLVGAIWLKRVTLRAIQLFVALLLYVLGAALIAGLI